MSKLRQAIKAKDMKALRKVVNEAVSIYNTPMPKEEPKIETAFGPTRVSLLDSKKDIFQVATLAYMYIAEEVENLPKTADRKVESAKLIASNSYLRYLVAETKESNDLV